MKDPRRRSREQDLFPITIFHVVSTCQEQGTVSEEREGKGKGRLLLLLQRLDPQLQGWLLTKTVEAREPEWTESNSNLLLDIYPIPACPTERQCGRQGPITDWEELRDENTIFFMKTHRSIFRIILLISLAGTILPFADTQASLVFPLDEGVRTGFNLLMASGRQTQLHYRFQER